MELSEQERAGCEGYLQAYGVLIGDQRTGQTFRGVVEGIIASESLLAVRIARFSPRLAAVKHAERRVRRMAKEESTKRSQLDADHLTGVLREVGAAAVSEAEELTLVLDGMELRREGAQKQEYLMRVRALDESLVNGYRSFNVLGLGEGEQRGLLYHKLFSSRAPDFASENVEIRAAIAASEQSLAGFAGEKTWVMDTGFDNDAVWWQIWAETPSHVVCRLKHRERIVLWQAPSGAWEERYLAATFRYLEPLARLQTELTVRLQGQKQPSRQTVPVRVSALPLRIYHPDDHTRTKTAWLVEIKILGAVAEPWYLLTDWPVLDARSARRCFIRYRRRWSVEDTHKFIKDACGIEAVQLLDFQAVRNLVALGWVAAGYLFQLGLTLDQPEVQLLARLGGWEGRQDRPPGKQALSRGLRRLLDKYAIEAELRTYLRQHGDLPAFVKRLMAQHGDSLDNYIEL